MENKDTDLHSGVIGNNTVKRKGKGGRPRKGSLEAARAVQVKKLIAAGVQSPALIAQTVGVAPNTAKHYLDKYGINVSSIELYAKDRVNILRAIQERITTELLSRSLEKVPYRDLVVSKGILYDKERLEMGKSTQNVASILAKVVHLDDAETKALRSQGADSVTIA